MAHPLLASMQEVLIVPLLPMALVAPHEMEKNVSPLYRYGPEPGGESPIRGEGPVERVSALVVFLPAQLSGGGPSQPEGF